MGSYILLKKLTESKSLFNVLFKCSATLEKRIMIESDALRQAQGKQEISTFACVKCENNPADALSRIKHSASLMSCVFQNKCGPQLSNM